MYNNTSLLAFLLFGAGTAALHLLAGAVFPVRVFAWPADDFSTALAVGSFRMIGSTAGGALRLSCMFLSVVCWMCFQIIEKREGRGGGRRKGEREERREEEYKIVLVSGEHQLRDACFHPHPQWEGNWCCCCLVVVSVVQPVGIPQSA